MAYSIAVNIAGTFTDLVAYDHNNHCVVFTKAPTTYGNFVVGVLDCFAKTKLDPRAASLLNHGTTLVINTLIQRLATAESIHMAEAINDKSLPKAVSKGERINKWLRRDYRPKILKLQGANERLEIHVDTACLRMRHRINI